MISRSLEIIIILPIILIISFSYSDCSILEEKIRSEVKSEKLTKELNIETEIIKLGGPYWRRLIEEGIKRRILSPMEIDLLQVAASIDTDRPKVASNKQAKLIWKIREKLENNGVLV